MPKITFIGAGSTIFLRHLLGDAVLMPSLSNAEIALMDIDEQRLAESELVARRVVETLKAGASVTAVSYTHLRAHETRHDLVCRLLSGARNSGRRRHG